MSLDAARIPPAGGSSLTIWVWGVFFGVFLGRILAGEQDLQGSGRGASLPRVHGRYANRNRKVRGSSDGGVNLQRRVLTVALRRLALNADVEFEPDRVDQVDQGVEGRVGALAAQEP